MLRTLILLMILIPAIEIWGLIQASQVIGGWATFFAVILTGVLGAYLAKKEGLKTWMKAQQDLSYGRIPAQAIVNGISIFSGGLLLLTPGFFTDAIGFALILPFTRVVVQIWVVKWLKRKMDRGEFNFHYRRF